MERLEIILDYFSIDYKIHKNKITFPCPIHGGDKSNGASVLTNSAYGTGIFKCWTNNCHEEYGKTVLGLIRGVLSVRQNHHYSYNETIDWLEKFLNDGLREEVSLEYSTKKQTTQLSWTFAKNNNEQPFQITRQTVLCGLSIPSSYFIGRGFQKETLVKYDVGICTNKHKPMYNRVVVPSYDDTGKFMVGCLGRTLKPQCMLCNKFHDLNDPCPSNPYDEYKASKWINNAGFNVQEHLYNFWFAQSFIEQSNTVILCEGAGDVWRLEEAGIHNGLGLFGAHFNDGQSHKLERLPIHNLIIATDNDDAGHQVRDTIVNKVGRLYNIRHVIPPVKDIGEMSVEQVRELFGEQTL